MSEQGNHIEQRIALQVPLAESEAHAVASGPYARLVWVLWELADGRTLLRGVDPYGSGWIAEYALETF
jgi:hypothetical protein